MAAILRLQAPHRAVREGGFLPACSGVFISRWHHGSPSHRYGLYALQFVQEVNGVPTPDLDAFVTAVSQLVSSNPIDSHLYSGFRSCWGVAAVRQVVS